MGMINARCRRGGHWRAKGNLHREAKVMAFDREIASRAAILEPSRAGSSAAPQPATTSVSGFPGSDTSSSSRLAVGSE